MPTRIYINKKRLGTDKPPIKVVTEDGYKVYVWGAHILGDSWIVYDPESETQPGLWIETEADVKGEL